MSTTPVQAGQRHPAPAPPGERRVRHQAQDAVTVMLFSGSLSVACALALLLLAHLGR